MLPGKKKISEAYVFIQLADGVLIPTKSKKFNRSGFLITELNYKDNGFLKQEKEFTYHSESSIVKELVLINNKGELMSKEIYDFKGDIISNLKFDHFLNEEVLFTYEYFYDKDKLVKREIYQTTGLFSENESKTLIEHIKYIYDIGGKLKEEKISEMIYYTDFFIELYGKDSGLSEIASKKYFYDKDMNLIKEYKSFIKSHQTFSVLYNNDKEEVIRINTQMVSEEEGEAFYRKFDKWGNLIRTWKTYDTEDPQEETEFVYSYDIDGNWIKRCTISNNQIIKTEIRLFGFY